jgi:hypothetical protein
MSTDRVKPAYIFNEVDRGNTSFNPAVNATAAKSYRPPCHFSCKLQHLRNHLWVGGWV